MTIFYFWMSLPFYQQVMIFFPLTRFVYSEEGDKVAPLLPEWMERTWDLWPTLLRGRTLFWSVWTRKNTYSNKKTPCVPMDPCVWVMKREHCEGNVQGRNEKERLGLLRKFCVVVFCPWEQEWQEVRQLQWGGSNRWFGRLELTLWTLQRLDLAAFLHLKKVLQITGFSQCGISLSKH